MGIETEMKDGEWETKKEREKEEGRLSVWKITADSRLLLLQCLQYLLGCVMELKKCNL